MRKLLPIPNIGEKYGMLTIISNTEKIGTRKACVCRCDCGAEKTIRNEHIIKGQIKSCGCLVATKFRNAMTKHGGKYTRLYRIWKGMRERCNKGYSPNNCRWVGRSTQNENRSCAIFVVINGEKISLAKLAKKSGIPFGTLYDRHRRGTTGEEILKPTRQNKHKRRTHNEQ